MTREEINAKRAELAKAIEAVRKDDDDLLKQLADIEMAEREKANAVVLKHAAVLLLFMKHTGDGCSDTSRDCSGCSKCCLMEAHQIDWIDPSDEWTVKVTGGMD